MLTRNAKFASVIASVGGVPEALPLQVADGVLSGGEEPVASRPTRWAAGRGRETEVGLTRIQTSVDKAIGRE